MILKIISPLLAFIAYSALIMQLGYIWADTDSKRSFVARASLFGTDQTVIVPYTGCEKINHVIVCVGRSEWKAFQK